MPRGLAFTKMTEFYKLQPIKLGCEVRGVDLKTEDRSEVIKQIKKDVTEHRLLVFKDQGKIYGHRQVEISKWFGELECTFFKHRRSPHPEVFRVSNDPAEGCTGVGRTGWHIDGTFQPAPYAYSLYFMDKVPKSGPTVFAPMTEIIDNLPPWKFAEWDRIYMASDRRGGVVHPLIYTHPRTKKRVLCFHLGMMEDFIYDYGTPKERFATPEEFHRIRDEIHHEFVKDDGKIQYRHEWQEGDLIISDNCAVAHEAAPETQYPVGKVGLRVLHRTTVHNPIPPTKEYPESSSTVEEC
ncbi:alpha-ketoglutarate-dependent 2,4-dichlorophenoxyacetate dioxygenase-like [Macrosteles quadrilineatus]|uniref:alpha-ketoglutarate-dependent 2,4-dichlorophenoxyacetate dioxygenase-like n=1 Tax=Macrosteles quadrilineatus TaxID=74068 RepID=UPI0023E16FC8|nr:alpha-ketoglutarate-dependent 2,4-dichlorophenoxyacetate dioxygenase-like [Macrosteles quadrilineatus]XP_054260802.1 alpha-ketoglutarate-dependent 2,4-dichlorophenoxyacetate dioxygenase-like [Macrosteles quadrilineatus]XP_054260803.1 alpha-ketoglutarate-dependent 2,4-dichlorophenoxyacetate dioxygenase-like [Macrosteles quadrilineatus]XP_054260804.1 alpha-ketoglutarate-dependent 2,4-dichlorophenoxyacetate dioxygenase-like [Macrosteles quadrilineatus]XP_054260805.1 alpha-ketoglutarate-dependen